MANNLIQIKRTSVTGRAANSTTLTNAGELALNMTDGIMYSTNGSTIFEVGANLTNGRITNSLTLNNNKPLRFSTVNTSAAAYFIQQNDDNFVFYTTNTSYGARPVFNIYANTDTGAFGFGVPVNFNANVGTLVANGSAGATNQVLTSNGSTVYWSSPGAATVNVAAQYTWTNTQTFTANISFTGNGIGLATNTGAIYLGGIADANWKIGRNTGVVTKWKYTNNTIDIITANSNLEGMTIGLVSGNSYFETGYLGTFIASNVTVGNSTVNVFVNASSFVGNVIAQTLSGNLTGNVAATTISGNLTGNVSATTVSVTGNTTVAGIVANSTLGTSGQVLTTNGTVAYWAAAAAGVNVNAQYVWTNTHTFQNTITIGNSTVNAIVNNSMLFFYDTNNNPYYVQYYSSYSPTGNLAYYEVSVDSSASYFTYEFKDKTSTAGFWKISDVYGSADSTGATFGVYYANQNIGGGSGNSIFTSIFSYANTVNTAYTEYKRQEANGSTSYTTGTLITDKGIKITPLVETPFGPIDWTTQYTFLANASTLAIGNSTANVYVNSTSFVGNVSAVTITATGNTTVAGIVANSTLGTSGQVLATNGSTAYWKTISTASAFTSLTDAPNTYSGAANSFVTVKSDETGLQFTDQINISDLLFNAQAAPATPSSDSMKMYVTASGSSPNREVALKVKNELGYEIIISSALV